jgi:metal-responsive CopG/Arc/MetJ family transcriptional regulator
MEKRDKTLTIRLPETLLKEMRELAEEHTRSLNSEVLVALQSYIQQQRLKPQPPNPSL